MQILDYKKQPEATVQPASSKKTLPPLAAITVGKSSGLVNLYRLIYGAFAAGLLVALLPWLTNRYWWWAILIVLWLCLRKSYKAQVAGIFHGSIWYEQGLWHVKSNGGVIRYVLTGEAVCWPFLLILPLREKGARKIRHLMIAEDSLSPADNARIRRWLRVCLKPKG